MNDLDAVVIDNGSHSIKVGFAGEDSPTRIPSIIGRLKHSDISEDDPRDSYVGTEAHSKRELLNIKNPVRAGAISNWDDMELLWQHVYQNELHVPTEERPLLMSEAPYVSTGQRERITQIMFETFNVPSFFMYATPILAMYSSGTTTGCIVESGDGVTTVMPIYYGIATPGATVRDGMSGLDVSDYFVESLNQQGQYLTTSADRVATHEIKERFSYISMEYYQENSKEANSDSDLNKTYELPDSSIINLGKERFHCPEIIFSPYIWGRQCPGVQEMIHTAIQKCDLDVRRSMWDNVVLAGGNTKIKGYGDRLTKELVGLAPAAAKVSVVAAPERHISVWIGGSILASLTNMRGAWMSRSEYEEHGPGLVGTKCKVNY